MATTVTNEYKTQAKRDIITLIDVHINDVQNEVSQELKSLPDSVPESRFKFLAALVDQRNMLARQFGMRERND